MPGDEDERRRSILTDSGFWLQLEYELSGWLAASSDPELRRYWIDGFDAAGMTNTQRGADVTGLVWMARGGSDQMPFDFAVSLPQALLYRREGGYDIAEVGIDEGQRMLRVVLSPAR